MDIDKNLVRMHFDRHAHEYDGYARVQKWMGEQLINLIGEQWKQSEKESVSIRRILEIGCGTGDLTAKLLALYPHARITAIDLSKAMLSRAEEKLGKAASSVHFVHGDGEDYASMEHETYDLIVSSAAFQWFNQPKQTVEQLMRLLDQGGMIAFSTFGPKTFQELHHSFRLAEQALHMPSVAHGQSFPDEAFWREVFADSRETNNVNANNRLNWFNAEQIEVFPKVRDFLHEVKRIGAGNAVRNQGGTLLSRRLLQEMERIYRDRYSSEQGVRVTYHLCFGIWQLL